MIGDLVQGTPYTLEDGTTVYLDDQGRVIVPPSPSAWDVFWSNPAGEIRTATGAVFTGAGDVAGSIAGSATGGFAAGIGKGAAAGLTAGLSEGLGGIGGAIALVGIVAIAILVLKR